MTTAVEPTAIKNPASFQELVVYQEWKFRDRYMIKHVVRFEEPLFRESIRKFFYGDMPGWEWESLLSEEERTKNKALKKEFGYPNDIRLAVYDGERFIGWTFGWQEGESTFYMATSGVLPEYRCQGIYSELVKKIADLCRQKGFQVVRSRHLVTNNSVIIPKLKIGFVITGMEISDAFGTMVQLSYFTNPTRDQLIRMRAGTMRPDPELMSKVLKD